jgi:hypothetical protein
MKSMLRWRIGIGLSLVAVLVVAIAPVAQAGPSVGLPRPDMRIRRLGGELKGNNIYSPTQTLYMNVQRGTRRQIIVTIQNDSTQPDTITVAFGKQVSYPDPNFHLSMFYNWMPPIEVTGALAPTLGPGQVFYLRVYVRVPVDAPVGGLNILTFQGISGRDFSFTDTVEVQVRAT